MLGIVVLIVPQPWTYLYRAVGAAKAADLSKYRRLLRPRQALFAMSEAERLDFVVTQGSGFQR